MTSVSDDAGYIGVELFSAEMGAEQVVKPSDAYVDVGKHHVSRRDLVAQRMTMMGEAAVRVSGQIIGKTVAELVSHVVAEIDGDARKGGSASLEMSTIQLTFGVKIAAGAGKAIEAFVAANGEASVQVMATFTRSI